MGDPSSKYVRNYSGTRGVYLYRVLDYKNLGNRIK